jgi:inhibitor of KinA sporulation pathway (predicted exonuclease)
MNNLAEIPMRRFKTLLVVDLEATCWAEGGPREDMETIEFGAVLVRMSDLRPIDERSWFIRPRLHPQLSDYCTNLISITQDQVDSGLPFEEVCKLVEEWLEPHRECLGWGSWGNFDKHQLQKDGRRLGIPSPLEPYHHTNLKVAFTDRHQLGKPRPGMWRALELCGLSIEGVHHRGIDDACNIARMLPWILDPELKGTVKREQKQMPGEAPFEVSDGAARMVSGKHLLAMKRKAQARDPALIAGGKLSPEDSMMIKSDQVRGATIEWPDVSLTDDELDSA